MQFIPEKTHIKKRLKLLGLCHQLN